MLNLNKTAVAVLVALGSSVVSAGTMGPVCTASPVTVPCEHCGWDAGIAALWLNPVVGADFAYETNHIFPLATATPFVDWTEFNRNRWQWAFDLHGSYHFGCGTWVNVEWYHMGHNNNGNHNHNGGLLIAADPGISGIPFTAERTHRWDAVNLDVHQRIDATCYKTLGFHGGFQWASIKLQDNYNYFPMPPATALPGAFDYRNHTFNGFGPRFGLDANLKIWDCGLYVGGDLSAAVLVGTSKFNNNNHFVSAAGTFIVPPSFGSRNALVPEIDTNVKLGWAYEGEGCKYGVEAGYLWFNYFRALHNMDHQVGRETDWGAHGPFIGIFYNA